MSPNRTLTNWDINQNEKDQLMRMNQTEIETGQISLKSQSPIRQYDGIKSNHRFMEILGDDGPNESSAANKLNVPKISSKNIQHSQRNVFNKLKMSEVVGPKYLGTSMNSLHE